MKLQIIIGSTRPGRKGLPIAQWFYELAKKDGKFDIELIDLKEVNLPFLDEPELPSKQLYTHQHTKAWSAKISQADAYVFVTPEYNYAMPAVLKNAIDYLVHEWENKPAGIVNYGGTSAGTRSAQMLKQVLTTLDVMPLTEAVNIGAVGEHMHEGIFIPTEKFEKAAYLMLDRLYLWAKHLKMLREDL